MAAFGLVYRSGWNKALAVLAFVAMAILYLWSSQVLIFAQGGLSIFAEPRYIAAALIMAALFGLLIPLEVYAFRLAAATVSQTGGTVLGAIVGTTSMTCCAPVILPSLLSLAGVSGASILGINSTLNRFWLPLATVSVILLLYSLVSVVQSLNLECELGVAPTESAHLDAG